MGRNGFENPEGSRSEVCSSEDVSYRSRAVKVYDRDSGKKQAVVYPYAVHYAQDGQWQEIDNTLQLYKEEPRPVYRNKESDTHFTFAAKADTGALVTVEKGKRSVTMQPRGKLSSVEGKCMDTQDGIVYQDIVPGTTARYSLLGDSLLTEIELADAEAWEGIGLHIGGEGLQFALTDNDGVQIMDAKTGETVFTLSAAYYKDATDMVLRRVETKIARAQTEWNFSTASRRRKRKGLSTL